MNSAQDVLPEDRAEFERVLDEALRSARPGDGGADATVVRRVREAALEARPQLTATAADEYHRYVRLREQLRAPDGALGAPERSGGGNLAVISVLIPVLAGIAAVVFLLVGYGMGLSDDEAGVAGSMRDIGWVFALFAAFGLLLAVAGLVVTAARNGSASAIRAGDRAPGRGGLAGDVAEAREDWRRALAERGIGPFLREVAALRDGGPGADGGHGDGGRKTPQLRFSSPDFSSPTGGAPRTAPRAGRAEFSQPRFSSPEFSTQGNPEEGARAKGYAAPDFSSPERGGGASRGYSAGEFSAGDFSAGEYSAGEFASPDYSSGGKDGAAQGERPGKGYATPGFGSPDYAGPRRRGEKGDGEGTTEGTGGENRP
ncbi:hypothetical protein ACFV0Z_08215 [Streptomyces xiamenensis]|uniref:hypothetical protein n=1 Tax=Streptomyces xiamenensis TaxID=408015 RepID=UPI0036CCD396